jgi:hypothetical protein
MIRYRGVIFCDVCKAARFELQEETELDQAFTHRLPLPGLAAAGRHTMTMAKRAGWTRARRPPAAAPGR